MILGNVIELWRMGLIKEEALKILATVLVGSLGLLKVLVVKHIQISLIVKLLPAGILPALVVIQGRMVLIRTGAVVPLTTPLAVTAGLLALVLIVIGFDRAQIQGLLNLLIKIFGTPVSRMRTIVHIIASGVTIAAVIHVPHLLTLLAISTGCDRGGAGGSIRAHGHVRAHAALLVRFWPPIPTVLILTILHVGRGTGLNIVFVPTAFHGAGAPLAIRT